MKRLTDKVLKLSQATQISRIPHETHYYELQKYENFMERYRFQNLEEIAELKQKLAEKDDAIANWETMYKSVVQTCHNDAKEIERLREQLADYEHAI